MQQQNGTADFDEIDRETFIRRHLAAGFNQRQALEDYLTHMRDRLHLREQELLDAEAALGAAAPQHLRQVAQQIRDHRAAGNLTTQG